MTRLSPTQTTGSGEQAPPIERESAPVSPTSAVLRWFKSPALSRFLQIALGLALVLSLWYVAGALGILNTRLIPPPDATFATTWIALTQGTMVHDLMQTLGRVLWAFVIAAGLGVPIGIVIGANERIYRSAEFLIDFCRSTPATAMFPLFMLIFGLGDQGKVALAAFSALLIIVFNVAYGVLNARKTRILAQPVRWARGESASLPR